MNKLICLLILVAFTSELAFGGTKGAESDCRLNDLRVSAKADLEDKSSIDLIFEVKNETNCVFEVSDMSFDHSFTLIRLFGARSQKEIPFRSLLLGKTGRYYDASPGVTFSHNFDLTLHFPELKEFLLK